MRGRWLMACLWVVVASVGFAADVAQYAGTWEGAWEGNGGGGKFGLTLQRDAAGAIGGSALVATDQGEATAKLRELAFDGNKMTAKFDFPNEGADTEITLTATFDASSAKGTWALGPKQGGAAAAAGPTGNWAVTKKGL